MDKQEKDRVRREFINRLKSGFRKVPVDNSRLYFDEICRQLSEFETEVLNEAADRLLRRARTTVWPVIGVCFSTCSDVRQELAKANGPVEPAPKRGEKALLPERVAVELALREDWQLVASAVRDGWHVRLVDFYRKFRQLPDLRQCEDLFVETVEGRKRFERLGDANCPGSIAWHALKGLDGRKRLYQKIIDEEHTRLRAKGCFDDRDR
ncbi:hypothetical protein IG616_20970 [Labrenzia suaedae]|uniref:Uncharacterized protein n=1 Tax=Roseibium litorale TaxID=2803841 RepID=A0ABR9CUY8_9HYPH|nr:hypothetical protein [Roseibium litorale]